MRVAKSAVKGHQRDVSFNTTETLIPKSEWAGFSFVRTRSSSIFLKILNFGPEFRCLSNRLPGRIRQLLSKFSQAPLITMKWDEKKTSADPLNPPLVFSDEKPARKPIRLAREKNIVWTRARTSEWTFCWARSLYGWYSQANFAQLVLRSKRRHSTNQLKCNKNVSASLLLMKAFICNTYLHDY